MTHDQTKSKKGLALVSRVRRLCERYPEVTEVIDGFGHTVFKVHGKSFIFIGEGEGKVYLTLRLLHETQDFLTRHQPKRFSKSAYIGQHGWTTLNPDVQINWGEVEGFIDEAYRRTAPKTVLKQLKATSK
ncbi:MAG: MmcQ/YjbR family DNA-binding protein [Anaerolineales bacterium]